MHAILESGPVVAGVVDRLDGAISLIDDLDENLNIFDVKLRHMREVSSRSAPELCQAGCKQCQWPTHYRESLLDDHCELITVRPHGQVPQGLSSACTPAPSGLLQWMFTVRETDHGCRLRK